MTSLASIVLLLQAALSLLALVQANPSLPQSTRDSAVLVAQNAIAQATTQIAASVTNSNNTNNSINLHPGTNGPYQGVVSTAPTCTMYSSHDAMAVGQTATLYWSSHNATSATGLPTYDANTVPVNGSQAVSVGTPGLSTYTIMFTGPGGKATCSTPIKVNPANVTMPSCTLTADKTSAKPGDSITLTWSSQNASRADWLADEQTTLSGTKVKKTDPDVSDYIWNEALGVQDAQGNQARCSVSLPIAGNPADVAFLPDVDGQKVTLHIRQTATDGTGGIRIQLQSVGTSAAGATVANLYVTIPGASPSVLQLPVGGGTNGGGYGDAVSHGGVQITVTDLSPQNQTAGLSISFVQKG